MRTKEEILKELHKNRQPGMYGGIPPDTKDSIEIEVLIDIRDLLFSQLNEDQERVFKLHQLP